MSTSQPLSLCVYCAARSSANPVFEKTAAEVGHWLGENNIRLVYGGGNTGLMGAVANAALEAGGQVYGIIPKRLLDIEFGHQKITELKVVDTMHERKQAMMDASHAFLTLPGGIGTFEEFFEAWTWRQLNYHNYPVAVLNVDGYYDGLLQFTQNCIDTGFMNSEQIDMLTIGSHTQTLLNELHQKMLAPRPITPFNGI